VDRLLQVAWAAGFLDGEGCFHAGKSDAKCRPSPTYMCHLVAYQSLTAPLERLRELFGGSVVAERPRTGLAKKQGYIWRLTDAVEVRTVLIELIPHLVAKRDQAELLLAFARTYGKGVNIDVVSNRNAIITS
jgi:hypothetical protein